jgi:hypothetical protein
VARTLKHKQKMATFLLAKKVNEHSVDAIIDVENQRVMCVVDTKAQGEWVAKALELLSRAGGLVGNSGTNILSSTDLACDSWQKDYEEFITPKSAP